MQKKTIMWFRQDLRISDNPALTAAANDGVVIPVFIHDIVNPKNSYMGSATKWWLHQSLMKLEQSLSNHLSCYQGNPLEVLCDLIDIHDVDSVCWNRCYQPWQIKRDTKIKEYLTGIGVGIKTFNASLLWEPWENLKADGTPYKVFTPFYQRGCLPRMPPRTPLKKPMNIVFFKANKSIQINKLSLLPKVPWYMKIEQIWRVGENAANNKLAKFLSEGIKNYKEGRDQPALESVSKLSPHLHFGEISPNQAWYAAKKLSANENTSTFLKELAWREFSYSLLYHFPDLPKKNWQSKFNTFPWINNKKHLLAWQKGLTGYPIVDAGMRELWQTGYMHNRVRMITASFLVKNCLIDWREGAFWFWDCLLDADLASNSASWQWVAGCGADAAPYFRIFNPVTQGKKFDKDGAYTRKYVPELKNVPDKYLFSPWDAPDEILSSAGVILGKSYPKPIVDLKATRERALLSYKEMKGIGNNEEI